MFFSRTLRLPHRKHSAGVKTRKVQPPKTVVIPMAQSIGAPCVPAVKVGDRVKTGQLIGDSEAFVSAPVHSSVTGTVKAVQEIMSINGKLNKALVIEAENNQELCGEIKPPVMQTRDDFIKAIRASGLVGLGGAGFPAHVKLGYDTEKFKVDTLIINAAECEPYICTDNRELLEKSADIIDGIKLTMKMLDIPRAIIAIERNKPDAISEMRSLVQKDADISVRPLPSKYPYGAEKVMIRKLTGRTVLEGQLPLHAGCLIMNVSGAAFISRYAKTGMPLITRRITIDGNIVNKPANLLVPIGMTLGELMYEADLRVKPDRVIFGGPMMGNCVWDVDTPICKTTGSVLFFKNFAKREPVKTACIRCGKCVRVCSMRLMPTELEKAYDARDTKLLERLKVGVCMECGSCSYVCPAKRNMAEINKLAKVLIKKSKDSKP